MASPTAKELLEMLEHYEEQDKFTMVIIDLRELCWKALIAERLERVPADTLFNTPALLELITKMDES